MRGFRMTSRAHLADLVAFRPLAFIFVLAMSGWLIASPCYAEWTMLYGDIAVNDKTHVQQTTEGGYILTSNTLSLDGERDIWVLKVAPDGAVVWQAAYGGNGYDSAAGIQQTADGGYVVVGATASFGGGGDAWVLKLQPNGAVAWQRAYGGTAADSATSVQQTADGGYVVTGRTASFVTEGYYCDILILKLDGDGNIIWQKAYGGATYDYANCVRQTLDGGYVIAGMSGSLGTGQHDAFVLKLHADGTLAWVKTYGTLLGTERACCIEPTLDGGYILAGEWNGKAWAAKLDAAGGVTWQKTYDSYINYTDGAYITQTQDGGYILSAETGSCLFKLNSDGTVVWKKAYKGPLPMTYESYPRIDNIQQTADLGYIMSGKLQGFPDFITIRPDSYSIRNLAKLWVLKLDGNGEIPGCIPAWESTAITEDTTAVAKDGSVSTLDTGAVPASTNASPQALSGEALEPCEYPGIGASIVAKPVLLSLATTKKNFTCSVDFSENYYGTYVGQASLHLSVPDCPECGAAASPSGILQADAYQARFPRAFLQGAPLGEVTIKVSGQLTPGILFDGTTTVQTWKPVVITRLQTKDDGGQVTAQFARTQPIVLTCDFQIDPRAGSRLKTSLVVEAFGQTFRSGWLPVSPGSNTQGFAFLVPATAAPGPQDLKVTLRLKKARRIYDKALETVPIEVLE